MSTVVMQPGGPGGGAFWRAEKVCCRQAKQSGAVLKARLRKLVLITNEKFSPFRLSLAGIRSFHVSVWTLLG